MRQQIVSFLKQKLYDVAFVKVLPWGLYFFIHINNLNNALDKCTVHHFADDTNLLSGNKCRSQISCVMNMN